MLISNPALQALSFLIASWRTEGTHPDVPDKTFHGRSSFEWVESGVFLIMHSEIDEPEIPSGVAIFGSDDGAERIYMVYFDERGVSRKFDVTVGINEVTCRRDRPKFSQIMRLRVDGGGDRLVGSGRRSEDSAALQDDLSLTYTRVQD